MWKNISNSQTTLHSNVQWRGGHNARIVQADTDQTKYPKRSHLSGCARFTNSSTTEKFR